MPERPEMIVLLRDATVRPCRGRHMIGYSSEGWALPYKQKSSVREHKILVSGKNAGRFWLGDKAYLTQLEKIDERMIKYM